MKNLKLFAIILSVLFLLVGCGKAKDSINRESNVTETISCPKYTVFVSSVVPSGELGDKGYVNITDSTAFEDANEYLDFSSTLSLEKVDISKIEKAKDFSFSGNSYTLLYDSSNNYESLNSSIEAFSKDKSYDDYVYNKGSSDEVTVTYNRDTDAIHEIAFAEKDLEPSESFTHEMAVVEADKLKKAFLGENNNRVFKFHVVKNMKQETRFVEVMYIRTICGYNTEQTLLVRFNHDGTLRSIGYGKLGYFSNSKCQIGALDYYETLLSKESIEVAKNELKKVVPEEMYSDDDPFVIGFDSNGNCLLHSMYLFGDNTLVKYYVNLFELTEKDNAIE